MRSTKPWPGRPGYPIDVTRPEVRWLLPAHQTPTYRNPPVMAVWVPSHQHWLLVHVLMHASPEQVSKAYKNLGLSSPDQGDMDRAFRNGWTEARRTFIAACEAQRVASDDIGRYNLAIDDCIEAIRGTTPNMAVVPEACNYDVITQ